MRNIPFDQLPRNLVSTYSHYSWDAVVPLGGFAYDSAREWATAAEWIADRMSAALNTLRSSDPSLVEQERDFLSKGLVCWRDKGLGTLTVPDPSTLIRRNSAQADALRPAFLRLGVEYGSMIRSAPLDLLRDLAESAPVPVNKGKGAPYWLPGSDRVAAIALAALLDAPDALTYDQIERRLLEVGQARLPMSVTSYLRIQGASKEQPEFAVSGGELRIVGTRRGPKTRRVQALMFSANYLVSQVAPILRWCLTTRTDSNTGTLEPAAIAAREYKYTVAADLSGYDESVASETLSQYRELVLWPVYQALVARGVLDNRQAKILLAIDESVQTMPLLAPSLNPNFAAVLLDREGGIVSGERLTSQKGTDINRERIARKAKMAGLRGSFFNSGDDTILCSNSRKELDRYAELDDGAGFKETLAPDPAYLMRRLPFKYAYLGRMLFNTLNREPSYEATSYTSAAAGVAIRDALLAGHPLRHLYKTILATLPESPRLKRAVFLSDSAPVHELLLASSPSASRTPAGATHVQELSELALATGLQTDAEHRAILDRLLGLGQRSTMRFDEIRSEAASLGIAAASKYIRNAAYTKPRP